MHRLVVPMISVVALLLGAVAIEVGVGARPSAAAAAAPAGFQDSAVLTGLTEPTAVSFAADGRVFVAEKSGLIKVFHGLNDPAPTVFADLRTQVHNFWDRGLLGLTLDPQFPTRPYVYVMYTYDAGPGETAPRWGAPGATSDGCPNPPGATANGCMVTGHLSKLTANGDVMSGSEQVLVSGWCQQFPSHSVGSLAFGADGKLYASAGEGASFIYADHGQTGNPCGDPAGEGGALRAQDLRTSGDPTGLSGSIIRVDPDTGAGAAGNPLAGSSDPNARRIIAEGLRNPFRFAIRPGTSEVWAGDVGWNTTEEVDRVTPSSSAVANFGWPCFEGGVRQAAYGADNICKNLPDNAVSAPYFSYDHAASVAPNDGCVTGSSSISGAAFYSNGNYPAAYQGAFFFADYSRKCIYVMPKGANGLPDPAAARSFITNAANPVSLMTGPNGDIYYTDLTGGAVHRITYSAGDNPPVASVQADTMNGTAPLTVQLDASGSSDPDANDVLTYSWDLNGDNVYGDASGVLASTTFTTAGNHLVHVKVTDQAGVSAVATVNVAVGPGAPVITIATPSTDLHWKAGDLVSFAGSATDATDGVLPPSALTWQLVIQHCPSNCHTHPLQTFSGVDSGSFTAPDHEYPSYLELTMTATDSLGLQTSKTVRIDPQTANLAFTSQPSGMQIAVGGVTRVTPFTETVIVNSETSALPVSPKSLNGRSYAFQSWSDGEPQSRTIIAPETGGSFNATFTDVGVGDDPIQAYYASLGGASSFLGSPVGNPYPVGVGRAQNYTGGRIYFSAATGAHEVHGGILAEYDKVAGPNGILGFPTSDESNTANSKGKYNTFTGGDIYWSAVTGAHEVHGLIRVEYLKVGGPAGILAFPITDETKTPDGVGRYNHFSAGGSVYWTPATGAHEVHGAIKTKWSALGWERSRLRYPTSDEYAVPGGRRSDFQGGSIVWTAANGAVTVTYR